MVAVSLSYSYHCFSEDEKITMEYSVFLSKFVVFPNCSALWFHFFLFQSFLFVFSISLQEVIVFSFWMKCFISASRRYLLWWRFDDASPGVYGRHSQAASLLGLIVEVLLKADWWVGCELIMGSYDSDNGDTRTDFKSSWTERKIWISMEEICRNSCSVRTSSYKGKTLAEEIPHSAIAKWR
jgi:hypothetical protein